MSGQPSRGRTLLVAGSWLALVAAAAAGGPAGCGDALQDAALGVLGVGALAAPVRVRANRIAARPWARPCATTPRRCSSSR
jgi:hypothetical protein